MPKAILFDRPGPPEVMQWREVKMPEPGQGEVLIKQAAAGLNYIDVYHRSGLYPMQYPAIPGVEGAGTVVKAGPGVEIFKEGMKVCYAGGPVGAYSEYRVMSERNLVGVPSNMSEAVCAGIMVKGLTAYFLLRRVFKVDKHATILVHAAAGGVGLLLSQWAKHLGTTVIGTAGSEEKAQLARANGCDHVILYKNEDFVAKTRELTQGRGVNVVYDSVGASTFMGSLDCLMPFGLMVSYGQASGPIPPFSVGELQKRGSLFLTRPSLMDYMQDHAEYIIACNEMLQLFSEGKIHPNIKQSYYLSDAVSAHRDLEARKTTGATVLLVQ